MNKVILMETGETPSLGPSRCFARLILSFALCVAKVPLPKCEGDDKGLQALFVFFISFSFRSVTFFSSSKSLFPHLIDPSTLTVCTRDV